MLLLLLLSRVSWVQLCAPTRLHGSWVSPGKNTGAGCHFLQCMKVKSESEVAQLCPTRSDPMDCSPPGSSVHGIFQARVLEWGAIAFSFISIPESKLPTAKQGNFTAKQNKTLFFFLCGVFWKIYISWVNHKASSRLHALLGIKGSMQGCPRAAPAQRQVLRVCFLLSCLCLLAKQVTLIES